MTILVKVVLPEDMSTWVRFRVRVRARARARARVRVRVRLRVRGGGDGAGELKEVLHALHHPDGVGEHVLGTQHEQLACRPHLAPAAQPVDVHARGEDAHIEVLE